MLVTLLAMGGRSARTLCVCLFFAVLSVTTIVSARTPEPAPGAEALAMAATVDGDVAYAAPMSIPPMATVSVPQNVIPDETVRRPDGPSSLALLAIGLAFLYFVRSRQWVR